ncbi:MAG: succinate dehydrogenase/fumarate reductase flavoprotein subunit, partial [Nitrospira sp.]|nr:succinate dehydrogenase/fumarate reductase flavoprotein subunit [Nitrospira sp.]
RNRLMGNSLLDLMVYGKRAGVNAAQRAKSQSQGPLTLSHVQAFRDEAKKHHGASGVVSPMVLPAYTRQV